MYISFAVFADAANLSQEGKLNVLGIFDALHVGAVPSMHPRAHFVVRVKGSAADVGMHQLAFRWLNPSDVELWHSSGELQVAAGPFPTQEMDLPIIAVVDLPIDGIGGFSMNVELDGEPVARVPVYVHSAAASGATSGSPRMLVS